MAVYKLFWISEEIKVVFYAYLKRIESVKQCTMFVIMEITDGNYICLFVLKPNVPVNIFKSC